MARRDNGRGLKYHHYLKETYQETTSEVLVLHKALDSPDLGTTPIKSVVFKDLLCYVTKKELNSSPQMWTPSESITKPVRSAKKDLITDDHNTRNTYATKQKDVTNNTPLIWKALYLPSWWKEMCLQHFHKYKDAVAVSSCVLLIKWYKIYFFPILLLFLCI